MNKLIVFILIALVFCGFNVLAEEEIVAEAPMMEEGIAAEPDSLIEEDVVLPDQPTPEIVESRGILELSFEIQDGDSITHVGVVSLVPQTTQQKLIRKKVTLPEIG